jgi:hypothetical protein
MQVCSLYRPDEVDAVRVRLLHFAAALPRHRRHLIAPVSREWNGLL